MKIIELIEKIAADVEALKNAPAPTVTVDQSEVLTAVADVKSDTSFIKDQITPTGN